MDRNHITDMTPDWRRTHRCGGVTDADAGDMVVVLGWVQSIRDHGGVLFLDVRDSDGIVQVVVSPEDPAFRVAESIRGEYVIGVRGRVGLRPSGLENPHLRTGRIEIRAVDLVLFNPAPMLPITVGDGDIDEALRLRYRYLDLRRARLHSNLALRHRAADRVRRYLNDNGFIEVETPFLTRSSPEGARDFLVPSRLAPGSVFALAQSPQLFKQLLMVAGYDRYFQIVRCFRDEDLRADRQPEFTQIDIEMSFVTAEDVMSLAEGMMADVWRNTIGVELALPFPRMTWVEAMSRYGTDKPDLRYGLEIRDLGHAFSHGRIGVFACVLADGGSVYGITVPGGAGMSRRELDELGAAAAAAGARGLAHFGFGPDGLRSPLKKFLLPEDVDLLAQASGAGEGDLVLAVAGPWRSSVEVLGVLRRELARRLSLVGGDFRFCWVVEFPLFEFDEAANRYESVHHPFTAPVTSDLELLDSDPGRVRAQAYDMVLNGTELGGGSIRIHRRDVQERAFRALNLDEESARDKFGYLLQALQFGAPPHGGVALGFDRIAMMLAREDSIREVIAFPKTTRGACLMTGAPSRAEPGQWAELGLSCTQAADKVSDGGQPSK